MCISIDTICNIVIAITAIAGVYTSITTWKNNTKQEKIRNTNNFIRETCEDSSIAKVFHKIDYSKNWYRPDFHNSDFEIEIDKVLIRYTYFIDLYNDGNIDTSTTEWLNYEIYRLLTNFDMQAYLFNLMNFTKRINAPFPYKALVEYGKKQGILDDTFFNVQLGAQKYPKTLNW